MPRPKKPRDLQGSADVSDDETDVFEELDLNESSKQSVSETPDDSEELDNKSNSIATSERVFKPVDILPREWVPPPGRTLTWDQLTNWLGKFNTEQWSHCSIYVYRQWPLVYREPKYIDIITDSTQLTLDYFISQFGGGKYKLIITDTDTRGSKNLAECYLKISHIEYEPIIDLEGLDKGHKDNKTFVERLKAKGILDSEGNDVSKQPTTQQVQQASGDLAVLSTTMQNVVNQLLRERTQSMNQGKSGLDEQVITRSMDLMSGAYKTALDTAVKQGNTSEVDQITKVMAMFTQLVQLMKPDKAEGGVWEKLLTIQAESHKAQMELMKEMIRNTTTQKDQGNQLEGLLGVLSKVKDIFGFEAPHGSSHRPSTLETILEKAPVILDPLARITENIINATQLRRGITAVPTASREMIPAATAATAEANPPQRGNLSTQDIVNKEQQRQANMTQEDYNNLVRELGFDPKAFVNQYGPIILQWLNNGRTGDELAEWVENGFGTATYLSIKNIGTEKIVKALKIVPEFWNNVASFEPQVVEFVDQFVAYGESGTGLIGEDLNEGEADGSSEVHIAATTEGSKLK